jgi:hypothetical protein
LGFVFREDAACGAECGDDGCHGVGAFRTCGALGGSVRCR